MTHVLATKRERFGIVESLSIPAREVLQNKGVTSDPFYVDLLRRPFIAYQYSSLGGKWNTIDCFLCHMFESRKGRWQCLPFSVVMFFDEFETQFPSDQLFQGEVLPAEV